MQEYISFSSAGNADVAKEKATLSTRQRQIVALVARHMSNKEIADILRISESTVKFHVARVFEKLNVGDRSALRERLQRDEHLSPSQQSYSLPVPSHPRPVKTAECAA
ncbi:MAG: response regulator transcription factor [Terriglobia bacterium]